MKTLAEIAIEAGLVTKAGAAKAGRMAEARKQPLVAVLIRELGVDEVALLGALRKQTRVPLIDPADVRIDPEALRMVARDVCARLRVLPLQIATEGKSRVMKVAIADPTDTSAILELEQLTHCEIEVNALPLSAIEELVDKGYRQFSTAVGQRPRPLADKAFPTTTRTVRVTPTIEGLGESETSVTAQIPMSALLAPGALDGGEDAAERAARLAAVEIQLGALCRLLVTKGVLTEAEVADALRKPEPGPAAET